MRIAGIIAEYDPFHNGHKAHIDNTKAENGGKATHIVTVMSGNFTQRGEPALLSKFRRTEMALSCGSDLVLELPLPWAMSPAEHFAAGGVAILNALGCVDLLSFGSECGDTEVLKRLGNVSLHPDYAEALKCALNSGLPYAAAGQAAAATILGDEIAVHLASPNNTLGIEYLRAMTEQGANWDVFTLQRQGALHGEMVPKDAFASASMLRKLVREDDLSLLNAWMPLESISVLIFACEKGEVTTQVHRLEDALLAHLRRCTAEEYANLPWVSEGLENRLYRESRSAATLSALLESVKTKRYPMARLRRVLWSSLIGLTDNDVAGLPPYVRVLGMNERGREILAKSSPTLPILTRTSQVKDLDERAQRVFALECLASDLHALAMEHPIPCGSDHTTKMILK